MNLLVSKFSETDIPVRVEWINNPLIYSQMYFDYPASVSKTNEWFHAIKNRDNRIDFSLHKDGQCVGMSGITDIDQKNQNAEFYVLINPSCQGQGLGKMLTKWTVNYCFLKYALNKVYLLTDLSNSVAIGVYEKLGFIKEGIQRKHKFKDGVFKDRVMYSILREEWEELDWREKEINLNVYAR